MNQEKNRIVRQVLTEYFDDEKIATMIMEERVIDAKDLDLVGLIERTFEITKAEFQKRTKRLLKEIEKKIEEAESEELSDLNFFGETKDENLKLQANLDAEQWHGIAKGFKQARRLIEKAFSVG